MRESAARALVLASSALFGLLFSARDAGAQDAGTVFRVESRLVEVQARVLDQRNRYIDGLTRDQFEVIDDGKPQKILSFEATTSETTCAILLDTTGSMSEALPVVKSAVLRFIDRLRPRDQVAVYSFSNSLRLVQDFTRDKSAAKTAVLRSRPGGTTALFDALAGVARDISDKPGKKAIIVFTDGNDNASILNVVSASARAKRSGVPVYTVAEGAALKNGDLVRVLQEVARSAGGRYYEARNPAAVAEVFDDITGDVQHTYLLTYRPPAAMNKEWRPIRLQVRSPQKLKILAKEGYFAD